MGFDPRSKEFVTMLDARLCARFACVRLAAGHYVQLDRPDVVNERLRRFVGEAVAP